MFLKNASTREPDFAKYPPLEDLLDANVVFRRSIGSFCSIVPDCFPD